MGGCAAAQAVGSGVVRWKALRTVLDLAETSREVTITVMSEIEQLRQIPCGAVGMARIWKPGLRIPQLVEEGLHHGVDRGEALGGGVLQELRDQINRGRVSFPENLGVCQRAAMQTPAFQHTLLNG